MKVVYRSILKELDKAREEAMAEGRAIEYIELTRREWFELIRECSALTLSPAEGEEPMLMGIPLRVKQ